MGERYLIFTKRKKEKSYSQRFGEKSPKNLHIEWLCLLYGLEMFYQEFYNEKRHMSIHNTAMITGGEQMDFVDQIL